MSGLRRRSEGAQSTPADAEPPVLASETSRAGRIVAIVRNAAGASAPPRVGAGGAPKPARAGSRGPAAATAPAAAQAGAARKRASRAREHDSSDDENDPPRQRFRGVTVCKNFTHPFQARCRLGGRKQSLGVYKTAVEAARAYDAFARRHGRTELNFVDEHDTPAPELSDEPAEPDEKPSACLGTLVPAEGGAARRRQPLGGRRQQAGQSSADLSAPVFKLVVRASLPSAPAPTAPAAPPVERGSTYRGVRFDSRNRAKPWSARCTIDGKKYYIGPHLTEEESARCYDQFLIDLGREPVNFPVGVASSEAAAIDEDSDGDWQAPIACAQLLDAPTKAKSRAASERAPLGRSLRRLREDEAARILLGMQTASAD